MRRAHKHQKAFTDLLGPLRHWLHSQIGRPWNDVYSEACEVIKPNSVVRLHIKTHLFQFVELNTLMHEGEVCVLNLSARRPEPIQSKRFGWSQFYVHPESGLLLAAKPESRRTWRNAQRAKRPVTAKWLDARSALKQIKGIWFMCEFRNVPTETRFKAYDHAVCQIVGRGSLIKHDGEFLHCISKRQLSRRELRRYKLTNAVSLNRERSFQRACCALRPALPIFSFEW